ncbi:hypothetical protein RclHR1_01470017 [Rhizophagus clarus]|uniref:Uncharacterized protein n=1 Tax=Rhizophagus clarus TaxID=94130 RepID=A0A2Z6QQR0_9GLOM|nr:hypothetical protein RclHR1_01470017 [Rhizophagus clarus]
MMLCTGGNIVCLLCKPVSTSFRCSLTVGLVGNSSERTSWVDRHGAMRKFTGWGIVHFLGSSFMAGPEHDAMHGWEHSVLTL